MAVTEKAGEGQGSREAQEAAGREVWMTSSASEPCAVVPLGCPAHGHRCGQGCQWHDSRPVCSCQLLLGTPSFNPRGRQWGSGGSERLCHLLESHSRWQSWVPARHGSFPAPSCPQPLPGMQWVIGVALSCQVVYFHGFPGPCEQGCLRELCRPCPCGDPGLQDSKEVPGIRV